VKKEGGKGEKQKKKKGETPNAGVLDWYRDRIGPRSLRVVSAVPEIAEAESRVFQWPRKQNRVHQKPKAI